MDDLGRVIAELMGTNENGAQAAKPALREGGPPVPDISGLLGALPGGDTRVQLLEALRPFLRPERRANVDRLCRLLRSARGVRGAVQSLGGIVHV